MEAKAPTTIPEWVRSLKDDQLARLQSIVADEQYQRSQEALKRQAAAAPTDEIGRELVAIQAEFAEQKAEEAQARADMRHLRMLDVRDRLRAGDVPPHFKECGICGRAILTLRHDLVCPTGKCYVNLIVR